MSRELEDVGYDTETVGLHPRHGGRLRLGQFYKEGVGGYVIDTWKEGGLERFKEEVKGKRLWCFNAGFEWRWLKENGCEDFELVDVAHLRASVRGGGQWNLAQMVKEDLGFELEKGMQRSDWSGELSAEQLEYARKDAEAPWRLMQKWRGGKGWEVFSDAVPSVCAMEDRGFLLDEGGHKGLVDGIQAGIDEALGFLEGCAGINWRSTKQVDEFFRELLPAKSKVLRRWKRSPKSRMLKQDRDTLKVVVSYLDDGGPISQVLEQLIRYKDLSHIQSAFGPSLRMKVGADGRIRSGYRIAGAVTGRFTCSQPNLQQIPRDERFRAIFKASEGNKLVGADFSQIEWRIAAFMSGDEVLIDAIWNGYDLHKYAASRMYSCDYEAVSKEQRQVAKALGFGILYGAGPGSISKSVGTTVEGAQELIDKFLASYPGLKAWREEQRQGLSVKTQTGRTISVEHNRNACYNYPVQGTGADLLLKVLAKLGPEVPLVAIVHDEFILDSSQWGLDKEILVDAMRSSWRELFPEDRKWEQVADGSIGLTWRDIH